MQSLEEATNKIVEEGEAAGKSWVTVFMALKMAQEEDVNAAFQYVNQMQEAGTPRWLIQKWAALVGIAPDRNHDRDDS